MAICLFLFLKLTKLDRNKESILPLDIHSSQTTKIHRLNSCEEAYGGTLKDRETYFANNSTIVDGYKVLLDCSYAVNSYYPEKKNEYFFIKDTRNNNKYYIIDNKESVLGGLNIIGRKDNFLFYHYCWEGCSQPEYFQLNTSNEVEHSDVYPEKIDILYRQGLPVESQMITIKNRAFFVSEHKIQELDTTYFALKDIKIIEKNNVFGTHNEFASEFTPDFEIKDNGILFKIYKNDSTNLNKKGLLLGNYFLKF